ncbi:MAG: phosphatase PAP2 family protein [Marinilabiliales bacterium]|nr:MAG: phosphatase PAP2 family protein [Marinilabiliales bacterium]
MRNYLTILFFGLTVTFFNAYGKDPGAGVLLRQINIPGTLLHDSMIIESGLSLFEEGAGEISTDSLQLRRYFANFLLIPYNAGLEIIRSDEEGLSRNIFVLCVLATTLAMDQSIRDLVQERIYAGEHFAISFLNDAGNRKYFFPVFAGVYGISIVSGDRYFHDTMLLSFQSLVVSLGFSELSKITVSRRRPYNSPRDPFRRDKGHESFVSGHAVGIWSVMTVFAGRYPKLSYGAYGFATAVSLARLYRDAHWTSDIVMGSLIGYGIGSLTLKLAYSPDNNLTLTPFTNGKVQGASLRMNF